MVTFVIFKYLNHLELILHPLRLQLCVCVCVCVCMCTFFFSRMAASSSSTIYWRMHTWPSHLSVFWVIVRFTMSWICLAFQVADWPQATRVEMGSSRRLSCISVEQVSARITTSRGEVRREDWLLSLPRSPCPALVPCIHFIYLSFRICKLQQLSGEGIINPGSESQRIWNQVTVFKSWLHHLYQPCDLKQASSYFWSSVYPWEVGLIVTPVAEHMEEGLKGLGHMQLLGWWLAQNKLLESTLLSVNF